MGPSCAQGLGVSVGPRCATYALLRVCRSLWGRATYALLRVCRSLWGQAVPHTRGSESGGLCGAELCHVRAGRAVPHARCSGSGGLCGVELCHIRAAQRSLWGRAGHTRAAQGLRGCVGVSGVLTPAPPYDDIVILKSRARHPGVFPRENERPGLWPFELCCDPRSIRHPGPTGGLLTTRKQF